MFTDGFKDLVKLARNLFIAGFAIGLVIVGGCVTLIWYFG